MALYAKINPVGVDARIQPFLNGLWDALPEFNSSWDAFPRVYLNPNAEKKGTLIAEHYVNQVGEVYGNDYIDVLHNDEVVLTTFFNVLPERQLAGNNFTTQIELFVQCTDLKALFPTVAHRPDEELIKAFYDGVNLGKQIAGITYNEVLIERVVTGIPNVYGGLFHPDILYNDMNEFSVFKFILSVKYKDSCK